MAKSKQPSKIDYIRGFVWKYFGTLVMEEKKKRWAVSLGRLSFVAVMVQFIILWNSGVPEVPPGLLEVFYVVASYVLGSKAIKAIKSHE